MTDLSKYVEMDPGAIYRVKISARKEYSLYDCQLGEGTDQSMTQFNFTSVNEPWNEDDWESGYYYYDYNDYYSDYNDYDYEYRYSERDDPCKDSFYRNMMVSRNVLVSDIGVIAKAGADKEMHIVLTDLNLLLHQLILFFLFLTVKSNDLAGMLSLVFIGLAVLTIPHLHVFTKLNK